MDRNQSEQRYGRLISTGKCLMATPTVDLSHVSNWMGKGCTPSASPCSRRRQLPCNGGMPPVTERTHLGFLPVDHRAWAISAFHRRVEILLRVPAFLREPGKVVFPGIGTHE